MLFATQNTLIDTVLDKYFLSCIGGTYMKRSSGESGPDTANRTLNVWGKKGADRIMSINQENGL